MPTWNPITGQMEEDRFDTQPFLAPVGAVEGAMQGALGAQPAPAAAPAQARQGYGMSTPQERAYYAQHLPDISSRKRALARQQALSEELRKSAVPTRRMDWASQAARALSGIGSAMADSKGRREQGGIAKEIARVYSNAPGMRDPDEDEAIKYGTSY